MQAKVSSYITVCVKGTLHQNQVSPALCNFLIAAKVLADIVFSL